MIVNYINLDKYSYFTFTLFPLLQTGPCRLALSYHFLIIDLRALTFNQWIPPLNQTISACALIFSVSEFRMSHLLLGLISILDSELSRSQNEISVSLYFTAEALICRLIIYTYNLHLIVNLYLFRYDSWRAKGYSLCINVKKSESIIKLLI